MISSEEEDSIVRMYLQEKMSTREIAKVVGCSKTPIMRVLYQRGVDIRHPTRKLPINSSAFSEVLTEEQAYWLGFLFADGCNYEDTGTIGLSLSGKDRNHLEKFREFLKSEHTIYDVRRPNRPNCHEVSLRFMDKKVSSDLARYGCHQRKTFSLEFPSNLPTELWRHFIRGYFDGDGCISIHERTDKRNAEWRSTEACARVVGTKEFLSSVQEILSELDISSHVVPMKSVFILIVGRRLHLLRFLSYLYEGSNVCLERKELLARKVADLPIPKQARKD